MTFTRRHLPHWIPEGSDLFVTWRLAGSPPPHAEILPAEAWSRTAFLRSTDSLDSVRCGPLWLEDPRIAAVVANALLYGAERCRFYRLDAWVIMPNHVHVIFQPRDSLPEVLRWLKGRTGRVANGLLGRTGKPFWQDESFDHWVRTAGELQELIEYVEDNPVKAGLVGAKEQWRWSSAGWKADGMGKEARLTDDG